MKRKSTSTVIYSLMMFCLIMTASNGLLANESAYNQDDPINSRMNLTITQVDGNSYELAALIRARVDNRYVPLEGLKVVFHTYNEDEENELGEAMTDRNGIARITVEDGKALADTSEMVGFGAIFDGNDEYEGSDDEVEIIKAVINMETSEETDEDGEVSRTVDVTFTSRGNPIEEANVLLYVKSMIRPLLVGDEETDEEGLISFEFPTDLPGNSDGTIDFYAFIEDDADYGNIKATANVEWGIERSDNEPKMVRSLSSPNPPMWLLLTFIGLLVFIWGHYIEVVIRLFRLKKLKV